MGRIVTFMLMLGALTASGQSPGIDVVATMDDVLVGGAKARTALARLDRTWSDAYVPMLVESMRLIGDQELVGEIGELLGRRTEQPLGSNIPAWFDWIWKKRIAPHPRYADVKARLYRLVDPRFAAYFSSKHRATVRLDEVRWGGVVQDGIPPLRNPKMIPAGEAGWLADSDVVFGVELNGDVRAYPERILAWHEMFTAEVGDVHVTGVY